MSSTYAEFGVSIKGLDRSLRLYTVGANRHSTGVTSRTAPLVWHQPIYTTLFAVNTYNSK